MDILLDGSLTSQMTMDEHRRWINTLWNRLQREAQQAASVTTAVRELRDENAELKLYVAVLARLLITKNICSVSELSTLLDCMDREDGIQDGKLTGRLLPGQKPRLPNPPRKLHPKPATRRS